MAKEIKVKFVHERSTKGAHRYQEVDKDGKTLTTSDDAVVGSLYLRKSKIGEDAPKTIHMTLALSDK